MSITVEEQTFLHVLDATMSLDNSIRQEAEARLAEYPFDQKLHYLVGTMSHMTVAAPIRTLALVLLRRLLSMAEETWPPLNEDMKSFVKTTLLEVVRHEVNPNIRKKITDVIAELAKLLVDENGVNQWPQVLEFLYSMSASPDISLRESSLNIFTSFPGIFANQEAHYMGMIHTLLQQSLADPDRSISFLAVKAVTSFIRNHEKDMKVIMGFRDCLPLLLKNIQESVAVNTDNEELQKCLIEIAEIAPKFLKPILDGIFEFSLFVMTNNPEISRKHLALEVMVTLSETAPGMVRKNAAKYIDLLIPQVLLMMVDLEEDPEWSTQDEIDDEDEDSNPITGESAMDRLACALGGKTMLPHILTHVEAFMGNADWRYRYAGLMTLSSTAEGAHKEMDLKLDQIMPAIVNFLNDPHPRVRYAACNCIGQMATDFSPSFQKKYHSKVIPGLLRVLDDEANPRVQAHGGAALVNFAEDAPKNIMVPYLKSVVTKLYEVLEKKIEELSKNSKKLVLEQIVTTIAAVADTVEGEFAEYYDTFMPKLKYIFVNATIPELRLLRGKTIECISLIGLAVGKEKFQLDCGDVMDTLLRTQANFENLEDEDPQISYMISSWARMCKILGKDFEKYLPVVMGPILKTAAFKPEITVVDEEEAKEISDDEDWQFVTIGDQKSFGIKTTGLEEKATACSMLVCYAKELKEGFVAYTEEVTKLMVPLFKFYFHDGVRIAAAEAMPHLLECAEKMANGSLLSMWKFICDDLLKAIETEPEQDVLAELMLSFSKCVEFVGREALDAQQVTHVITILDKYLNEHFKKQQERHEARHEEDYDEETEDQYLTDDDYDAMILSKVADIVHSLFKVYGVDFTGAFDHLVPHFVKLLGKDRPYTDRQWALCVWDDVLEFCGPNSINYQEFFLGRLIDQLHDEMSEVRQAANYGVGLMAMHGGPQYARACAECLPALMLTIQDQDSKSVDNLDATENAISAMTKILKYNNSEVDVNAHLLPWLSCLPVFNDTEETKHTYGFLCDLCEANNTIIMGEQAQNVPHIVRIMLECFAKEGIDRESETAQRMSAICSHIKATPEIVNTFYHTLPADLQSVYGPL